MDKWDGYDATRERLFKTLKQQGTANPVILSGDVHTHWAADVKARPDDPASANLGTELTASSITSGGDGSAELDFWQAIRTDNPQIHYHSNRRGYIASDVTIDGWTADFKTVRSVTRRDVSVKTGQTAMIEAGLHRLQT